MLWLNVLFTALLIVLVAPAFSSESNLKYAEKCTTSKNESGKCMPIKSCSSAYKLYLSLDPSSGDVFKRAVSDLQQSQCGFVDQPYVCCPEEDIQMNSEILAHLGKLQCGLKSTNKVANGDIANLFDYRWMALLKYDAAEPFGCAGSLIDEFHVLTAAHCIHNFTLAPTEVRLGEFNITSDIDCAPYGRHTQCLNKVEDIPIERIFVHEDYVSGINHDIALIRLSRPVKFSKHIFPICLPLKDDRQVSNSEDYLIAGWGLTELNKRSDVLRYAAIPKQPLENCEQSLRLSLRDHQICAGGSSFRDSCRGDSGGPIFQIGLYTDRVARTMQYGIVSAGARTCGEINLPAVYTNVQHYLQWITDHMVLPNNETTTS